MAEGHGALACRHLLQGHRRHHPHRARRPGGAERRAHPELYRVLRSPLEIRLPGMSADEPHWLRMARELRAIAQTGLTFSVDRFDRQRYERVRELAASMLAEGSGERYEVIIEILREGWGYTTPKVDVRGAAFVDGRVLMVREISDGKWTLPGGWADVNQSAAECVVREIAEESGFQARARKLAAVRDYQKSGHPARHVDSI